MEILAAYDVPMSDPRVRWQILDAVLTGVDREAVVARLGDAFLLTRAARRALMRGLHELEGEATVIAGAERLLRVAVSHGWRVVVATNAASWASPLPPGLASLVSATVSSSAVGVVKHDVRFWRRLLDRGAIDRTRSLIIGDSEEADVAPAVRAGLLAIRIRHPDRTAATVADWVATAGRAPAAAVAFVGGEPSRWADRWVLDCPHLTGLVERVTRLRVKVHHGGRPIRGTVIRRQRRAPAFVLKEPGALPPLAWLSAADGHSAAVPVDLARIIEAEGLSMAHLGWSDRSHLLSLVREARDPLTRDARIADIVAHLRLLRSGGGSVSRS